MDTIIAPSLLAADFGNLTAEVKKVEDARVKWLHLDVMDGHFVPNISFGADIISAVRKHSRLFFDVHLMISEPLRYLAAFAGAGADSITFHVECNNDVAATLSAIRALKSHLGCAVKAGLSVKPATPIDAVFPYLDSLDMVLIMTVEPGFGGQSFMADMLPKITALRKKSPALCIQVDGGISPENARLVVEAGANCLVAGSAIFGAKDVARAVQGMLE